MKKNERCFACDRPLGGDMSIHSADTRDDQIVYVGSECFKKIKAAREKGYQPPKGGPRLWLTMKDVLSRTVSKEK